MINKQIDEESKKGKEDPADDAASDDKEQSELDQTQESEQFAQSSHKLTEMITEEIQPQLDKVKNALCDIIREDKMKNEGKKESKKHKAGKAHEADQVTTPH